MAICKFCGKPFAWGNDGERWVPLVPIGQDAGMDRDFQDENGELRAGHRNICIGYGPSVRVVKLAKKIEAQNLPTAWTKPDEDGVVHAMAEHNQQVEDEILGYLGG